MPGNSIAAVEDQCTREAMLGMREEFFRGLKDVTRQIASTDTTARMAVAAIDKHAALCTEEKRADQQWRESMTRLLEKMDSRQSEHFDHDDKRFAAKAGKTEFDTHVTDTNKWKWKVMWTVLGAAGAIILGLLGLVGYLIAHHGIPAG